MFEVNATRKTFAGHKFYSETVLDEFCEAVLISSILYLKYSYWDERLRDGTYRWTVRTPDGQFFKGKWLIRVSVNITFLKKCNDEQNNASRYKTFVIVQTDWFEQKIYVFLDSVFSMTNFRKIQWGASSRWPFSLNSACCSIERRAIEKTHSTSIFIFKR